MIAIEGGDFVPDANITKNALASSMKKLMKEKVFEKISVIDICEGCGMNRKSFYYHFKDKYDLVNWIFYTDFIKTASKRSYSDGWDLLTALVELFSNDRAFYKAALEIEGQNSFRDYFYEATVPIFSMFSDSSESDNAAFDTHYLTDVFLVIMYRWLSEEKNQTPEEFIRRLKQVLVNIGKYIMETDTRQIET
ncbi:MAG: TetR/AcrR family transcriptional regulator C-terminal domain-containing protein [Bilifractor sp.]